MIPSDSNLSKVSNVKASNKMIANYKKQDLLLKKCLQLRTNENEELYNFIKDSVGFNTEVFAHLELQMKKHFK